MLQTYRLSWVIVMKNLSSPIFLKIIFSGFDSGNLWTTGIADFSIMK